MSGPNSRESLTLRHDAFESQLAGVAKHSLTIALHVFVESDARPDWPGSFPIIAKLDRLSRNLAFIAALMESGVEFVAVDNPHATKLTVHILAAVAEHEREMISERTRAALKAAKARETRLGNPQLAKAAKRRHGRRKGECAAVCSQCAADHRGDREGRHHEPQCHSREAQRSQRANGARWQMDSRSGWHSAAPFRGKRGRPPVRRP